MERGNKDKQERGEERREHVFLIGPWKFNVTQAQELITQRPRELHRLPVADWARFYGLAETGRGAVPLLGPEDTFDREYAMTKDISEPVILAMLRDRQTGEDLPLLIDGTHRLYRAYMEGVPELPAYVLSTEESLTVRTERFIG